MGSLLISLLVPLLLAFQTPVSDSSPVFDPSLVYNDQPLIKNINTIEQAPASVGITNAFRDIGIASASYKGNSLQVPDTIPPKTKVAFSGVRGKKGWYRSDVQVTLKAADNKKGSGLAKIEFRYDGSNWTTYSTPFLITAEATYVLSYRAVDNAGNTETIKTVMLNIDKTPPKVTFDTASPAPNAAGWNNTNVNVSFTASDAVSGVAKTNPGKSPIVLRSVGTSVTSAVIVSDLAGNSTSFLTPIYKIDKTPPVIKGIRTPLANSLGWSNEDVTITFNAADSLSGVDIVSEPITVTSEGRGQSVYGIAKDKAGNISSTLITGINIDKTPPAITAKQIPLPNVNGWNNSDVTVVYLASDSLSGIYRSTSSLENDDITTERKGQTASGTAFDRAGNSASVGISEINIDKTSPNISVKLIPNSLWSPNHQFVTVNALIESNDDLSGSSITLESIVSYEPDDNLSKESAQDLIQGATLGTDDREFQLRAQRSGKGNGSIYYVTYAATDGAGNRVTTTATVSVPRNQSK